MEDRRPLDGPGAARPLTNDELSDLRDADQRNLGRRAHRDALLLEQPAPNLRRPEWSNDLAVDGYAPACGNCRFGDETGLCERHAFQTDEGLLCDSWELASIGPPHLLDRRSLTAHGQQESK